MPRKKSIAAESVAEATLAEEKAQPKGGRYVPRHGTFKEAAAAKHEAEAVKKIAKVPKRVREEMQKMTADGDLVDIWERRILNPNHQDMPTIRIKTPGMYLRWINLANRGRYQRARYEQGYVPVHKNELVDEREVYGVTYTSEGFVCRGEKQNEMLMRIPDAVYKQIQRRRAELNTASYKKLRETMGSAGAQHFKNKYGGSAGDVAAEAASQFVGSVKFGTERVTTDELLED